ncbi:PASTA domain-containing protein [Terrabacter tumescens]|uniref:PASTA domain-containing protein n=1 Tax=Terrabacter tumescens TaxID=60443 RepID=UPI0006947074|nr:PASTA domain-containing protein [Terrabacter tumescens]
MNDQGQPTPAPTEPTIQLPPPALGQPHAWAARAQQPQPQKRSRKHLIGYPVTALLALGIGAAGGGNADATAPAAASPTVVVTQTAPAPAPATVTQTVRATVTVAAPVAAADAGAKAVAKPASKITVPDGVGLNYQDAQDLWRAAGLVVAPAEDATGANRLPVLDSNWVVLAQDLKAGSKVPADSMITATVKKYTDG